MTKDSAQGKYSKNAGGESGYVPTDEWPDVTVMLDGFGDPSLASSSKLEESPVEIRFENGETVRYEFSSGMVTSTVTDGARTGKSDVSRYRAVEARPGIFFVDFLTGETVRARDHSLIVNVSDGRSTLAESYFINRDDEIRMDTDITSGRIAGFGDIDPLPATDELVGKRIFYRYSETEHYEHYYLNPGTFVWHCVRGGEAGLTCADPVRVYALDDNIVLLHWSETVKAVESIVVIDLEQQRSIGRMFCWDGPTLNFVYIPFDSQFTVLSDVQIPDE